MRKTLSLLLVFLLMLTAVPTRVAAEETALFVYALYGENAAIAGYKGTPRGELVIPDTVDGHPVVHIEAGSFRNCTEIESVTLPKGVKYIMEEAFAGCTALRQVTFSEGLWEICDGAFRGCIALEEAVLPDSVGFIDKDAFRDCRRLQRVTLSQGLQYIGSGAFENCTSLTKLVIPKGSISSGAFRGSGLQTVTFEGVSLEIAEDAFAGLTLTAHYDPLEWPDQLLQSYGGTVEWVSAGLPEGVHKSGAILYTLDGEKATVIGCTTWLFSALEIPATLDGYPVVAIGEEAFAAQQFITVYLPEGVTTIGARAFKDSGIMQMRLPGSVTAIGEEAFAACSYLSDIFFEGYIPDMAPDAFTGTELTAGYYLSQWPEEARQPYGGRLTWQGQNFLGDVDGDGAITSTDARLALQYYVKKIDKSSLDLSVVDVDGDRMLTSTDARLILQFYAGKITAWPQDIV